MAIPFIYKYDLSYGEAQKLTPLIRRVTANNPSGFTFRGTCTYIIGKGNVAVIDPGPLMQDHIDTLKQCLEGEKVTHIFITHTHGDHSPAAAPLKNYWDCKTYAFGPHGAGKIAEGVPIEEGGDMDFFPDVEVRHGDVIEGDGWTLECVYTPGHTSNHLCFALEEENALFTGDHIMGWSTSVIGPPDGDMTQYMDSLSLLLDRDDEIYWPAHGTCIENVKDFVQAFIDHRLEREQQILKCLDDNIKIIPEMVPVMYVDTDKSLHGAAAQSVLAAMERLVSKGRVLCSDEKPGIDSHYKMSR